MTGTHIVRGSIGQGPALETCISDDELKQAIEAEPLPANEYECDEVPGKYSDKVMAAYRRAKKASVSKNESDRRIVQDLRMEREAAMDDAPKVTGQTALFDFKK